METENPLILDTDILIELSKKRVPVTSEIREIGEKNIIITKISVFEMYVGALNKNELLFIKEFLSRFPQLRVTDSIINLALKLVYDFNLSHTLFANDAIIAASAIYYGLELFTLNIKDYRFIPNLKLYKFSQK